MRIVCTQDIPFHESPLVSFNDNRGWLTRIKDLSLATVKEFKGRWQRQYNPLKTNVNDLFPSLNSNSSSTGTVALNSCF